jgi:thiamine kinase-like enzyme
MQRTARQGRRIADELDAYPRATAHGDACPNNLLVCDPARPDLVMIDFGFWSTQPVGFDLGQQQLGEAQLGRRSAADVVALDDQLVTAYVDGLRAESYDVACAVVRRAHALQMVLFSGLSAVPWELFDLEPTEERLAVAGTRADLARFTLDLLDATGGL